MRNTFDYYDRDAYLEHHGIKGQKWGVRRFQNPDGSLTYEGKTRYGVVKPNTDTERKAVRSLNRTDQLRAVNVTNRATAEMRMKRAEARGRTKAYERNKKRYEVFDEEVKRGEKIIEQLLSDSKIKGYHISSIDKTRYTHGTDMFLAQYLFGIPGSAAVAIRDVVVSKKYGDEVGGFVPGKKYVRNRSKT